MTTINTINTDFVVNPEFVVNNEFVETMETRELNQYAIFRFKFTEDFMKELFKFSKIHQYDERKDFKEAWNIWIDENSELVDSEMQRLIMLRYAGDIINKMFK